MKGIFNKKAKKEVAMDYEKREPISRTAPKGRRSIMSDRAVEEMCKENEKKTNEAIRKIGRSVGF